MPLTQRAMDRELAMALTTATADDDEKCPDDVMKRLVKLSGKQKDPAALEDLVATLAAKLQDGSFKVKLKTLRCTMMVLNDKRSGRLKDAIRGSACLDAVSALVEFTMEADPVHGDKPQQMVRTSASRCLDMIGVAPEEGGGGGGFAAKARAKAQAAQAKAEEKAKHAKETARAKAEEAKAKAEGMQAERQGVEAKADGGPAAPTKPISVGVGPGSATVCWSMPEGVDASEFELQWGFVRRGSWKAAELAAPPTADDGGRWTATVKVSAGGDKCVVRVRGKNAVGWGDWSPKSDSIETLEAAEPAPAPAAAAAGDTSSESDLARATADDDQKLPDDVVKAIVASAIKGDESTVSALVEEFDQRLQASSARYQEKGFFQNLKNFNSVF